MGTDMSKGLDHFTNSIDPKNNQFQWLTFLGLTPDRAKRNQAIQALQRQDKEIIWGSMVKQAIKRKHPEFNEEYYGYNIFSRLLEDMQAKKLVKLEKDARSGSYVVTTVD